MIPRRPEPSLFRYGGLSTLSAEGGEQTLLLVGDQGRAGPGADLIVRKPVALREALSTLLRVVEKGFGYSPSSPEVAASAGESYESWKQAAPNLSPVASRQGFHAFLAESDPEAWLVMDPVVTLLPGRVRLEVFDKRGRIYAALTLREGMFEGSITPGTLHVEAGLDLVESLSLIHGRAPLRLRIGAEVSEALDGGHRGELEKAFTLPLSWQRQLLQMLAAATLPAREVPLARVDLFNALRHLRLNKEARGDDRAMRFALVPGEPPEITLEPWEWRYTCTGPAYRGEQSEIIGLWDRREPLELERVLPYVEAGMVRVLGEAQPTFWSLDCGDFSFTLATPGFRAANWSRGLMMDIHLPRHTPAPEGLEAAGEALKARGRATAEALAADTGLAPDAAAACLRRIVQEGEASPEVCTGEVWRRQLLPGGVDTELLRFRSGQEGKAWRLVEAGRVEKHITVRPTGEVDFVGPASNGGEGAPSVVTEPRHPFQEREPRFTPKLELNRAGATRKPGCTCTFWKRQSASTKTPCAHLQALWLRHCLDRSEERALEATDPSRITIRNSTYVKRAESPDDGEVVHELRLMFSRVTESWGTRAQLRGKRGRRQVLIFHSVDAARAAYFARCSRLEQKGFLNASG